MRNTFFILLSLLLIACEQTLVQTPMDIIECADAPIALASASVFVLNDEAYLLGGRLGADWSYPNNFYRYNPTTDKWTQLSNVPFDGRCNMVSVVCNGIAYCGGGFAGDYNDPKSYKTDWWSFNGTRWTRLNDLPTNYSDGLLAFALNNKIYIGYGYNQQWTSELYAYDPLTDTWSDLLYADINDFKLGLSLVCIQNDNHIFAGLGFDTYNNNFWTEYNVADTKWHKRTPLPCSGGVFYAGTATDSQVFLCGGRSFGGSLTTGRMSDIIWSYNIADDKWSVCAHLPQPTENMIAFTINNTPYFGLGEDADGNRSNQLFKLKH